MTALFFAIALSASPSSTDCYVFGGYARPLGVGSDASQDVFLGPYLSLGADGVAYRQALAYGFKSNSLDAEHWGASSAWFSPTTRCDDGEFVERVDQPDTDIVKDGTCHGFYFWVGQEGQPFADAKIYEYHVEDYNFLTHQILSEDIDDWLPQAIIYSSRLLYSYKCDY